MLPNDDGLYKRKLVYFQHNAPAMARWLEDAAEKTVCQQDYWPLYEGQESMLLTDHNVVKFFEAPIDGV